MKKYIPLVFIIFLLVVAYFCFNQNVGESNKYNLSSQIEYNYFNLYTQRYNAECMFGVREINFDYDGKSTEKVEYGIFKITFLFQNNYAKNIDVNLKINNKINQYKFEQNPFDGSFMCDICKTYYENDLIEIMVNNIDDNYKNFTPISNAWKIDYKKAINIIFNYSKNFVKNNKNSFEGFLTIIYNKNLKDTEYFWCYRFVTNDRYNKLYVIDVNSGDIVLIS